MTGSYLEMRASYTSYEQVEGKVRAQEEEIKRLKKAEESSTENISALEMKLDVLEQQARCNNIRFLGVKESEEEVSGGIRDGGWREAWSQINPI